MHSHEISVEELGTLIGRADCPVLIDTRIDEDFALDPRILPGARRIPHRDVADAFDDPGRARIVVYCQKGLKLSMGSAAFLREAGINAVHLTGGHLAWQEAGLPMLTVDNLPGDGRSGTGPWVGPARPDLGAMFQVWLIRRFVSRDARIIYVSADHAEAVAEKFDGATIGETGTKGYITDLAADWGLASPDVAALADWLNHQQGTGGALAALYQGAMDLYPCDHDLERAALSLLDCAFQKVRTSGVSA